MDNGFVFDDRRMQRLIQHCRPALINIPFLNVAEYVAAQGLGLEDSVDMMLSISGDIGISREEFLKVLE